jgi:hypothetical protein
MSETFESFKVTALYSNEQIYKSLCVGNAGGVRVKTNSSGLVERLVIFTSIPTARQLAENPYHDRLEGDVLIYTGAGRAGDQSVSGANARLVQQQDNDFPIYGFIQMGSRRDPSIGNKRWGFLGLLEYLRCYRERQIDSHGKWRNVWIFELRVHSNLKVVRTETDKQEMQEILASRQGQVNVEDREVVSPSLSEKEGNQLDLATLEPIRRQLLGYEPRQFEHVIHDLLQQSGFDQVEVTKYSQDGGIDVNARPGKRSWPLRHLLIQLQAKRWLHTVGRKEIAELRGSLQPHAAGCIVTTSHFSRAALAESAESGKVPITAIDGYELANIVKTLKLKLA